MSDKEEQQKQQGQEEQNQKQEGQEDHIPVESKDDNEQNKSSGSGGLLSMIGDPVGKVLGTALRPVGAPLEKGVTGPLGNALGGTTRPALGPLMGHEEERSEFLGGKNVDSYEKPEKIAGKEQTGDNPLGLDQTGRWGFQDDEEGEGGKKSVREGGGHV